MHLPSTAVYFRFLAYVAIFLLWGISLLNGTVKVLLLAVWNGQMREGETALENNYTGIPLLDYPIAVLVAFFFYGTSGYDQGYQLFLLDAYSTLQSAFVWLYVETLRPGNPPKLISRPVVFGLLWQCFGGAISLPLYYAYHVDWAGTAKIARARHLEKARALPLSFILGAVVPALIGMAPTWLGPESRSAKAHQTILAAWQPDPLWVSGILMATSYFGTWLLGRSSDSTDDRYNAFWWVRTSYLLAATTSALGHLYVVGRMLSSDNEAVSMVRMYVPNVFTGPSGNVSAILVWGPWLFLKWDLIIISLSSLAWAVLLYRETRSGQSYSRTSLGLAVLAASLLLGPGATVSLLLFLREGQLSDSY